MATTRIRAEPFPDLADQVLYPRLSEHKMAWLAEKGERRSFATGEVLYEQGLRDAPFFVIESGRVDLIDRKPGKEIWIAEADVGTFMVFESANRPAAPTGARWCDPRGGTA